jgi:hypothetical protein
MGIGTFWRHTTSDFDQWVVDGLNQIQIALDQYQLVGHKWPNKHFSFDEAEEFIDELRGHFAAKEDSDE